VIEELSKRLEQLERIRDNAEKARDYEIKKNRKMLKAHSEQTAQMQAQIDTLTRQLREKDQELRLAS
jgi:DNA-binding transcriptional MerR regulator